MARREVLELIDDLDGGLASQTLHFSLEGKHYEIDLNERNVADMRETFELYAQHAREVAEPTLARRKRARSSKGTTRVREWAAAQGIELPSRGRIPKDVHEAYEKANRG